MKCLNKSLSQLISEQSLEDLGYIEGLINYKNGDNEDILSFFDELEDIKPEFTEKNIYLSYDLEGEVDNLFFWVNAYSGDEYNEEIEGPQNYQFIGFSAKSLLGANIYIDEQSMKVLREERNILASIVWEFCRFGNTDEEREEMRQIIEKF